MRCISSTPTCVTIQLTVDEVDLVRSALNETNEALRDWEFQTRTGFERQQFHALQASLSAISEDDDTAIYPECGSEWKMKPTEKPPSPEPAPPHILHALHTGSLIVCPECGATLRSEKTE
ncbi:MAG: hypothetical protein H6815_12475 [Phycisphaeraceae bacterium]|nr:hypothetical protein [Phycisphaerales bacterium]MCB9861256.1 hypothetical protein [Phycisphaeraceae bacterium]